MSEAEEVEREDSYVGTAQQPEPTALASPASPASPVLPQRTRQAKRPKLSASAAAQLRTRSTSPVLSSDPVCVLCRKSMLDDERTELASVQFVHERCLSQAETMFPGVSRVVNAPAIADKEGPSAKTRDSAAAVESSSGQGGGNDQEAGPSSGRPTTFARRNNPWRRCKARDEWNPGCPIPPRFRRQMSPSPNRESSREGYSGGVRGRSSVNQPGGSMVTEAPRRRAAAQFAAGNTQPARFAQTLVNQAQLPPTPPPSGGNQMVIQPNGFNPMVNVAGAYQPQFLGHQQVVNASVPGQQNSLVVQPYQTYYYGQPWYQNVNLASVPYFFQTPALVGNVYLPAVQNYPNGFYAQPTAYDVLLDAYQNELQQQFLNALNGASIYAAGPVIGADGVVGVGVPVGNGAGAFAVNSVQQPLPQGQAPM